MSFYDALYLDNCHKIVNHSKSCYKITVKVRGPKQLGGPSTLTGAGPRAFFLLCPVIDSLPYGMMCGALRAPIKKANSVQKLARIANFIGTRVRRCWSGTFATGSRGATRWSGALLTE